MTTETEIPAGLRAKPDRLTMATAIRRVFHYTVESGKSVDDTIAMLGKPMFWSKVGNLLRPLDHVEVVDDNQSFFAECIVLRADNADGVVLKLLRGVMLDGAGTSDTIMRDRTGMQAVYKGPHLKWCVLRGDDVLSDRHQSEAAAHAWINQQTRAHAKDAA